MKLLLFTSFKPSNDRPIIRKRKDPVKLCPLHQGKAFKDLIDTAICLIYKKDAIIKKGYLDKAENILEKLNLMRKRLEKNWGRLFGRLALQDLNRNKTRYQTKKLLHLTGHVMNLRNFCTELNDVTKKETME